MCIQFTIGTMLWLLSGIAGGCILVHGLQISDPLEVIAGLTCMSSCAGVLAAKLLRSK